MEYKILRSTRDGGKNFNWVISDIEKQVNQAIQDGWKPLGGVVIANTGLVQLAQAMIRE